MSTPSCQRPLAELIAAFAAPERLATLQGMRRGLERETLRLTPEGTLAQAAHPHALGSALFHANITTDFSEAMLELITPPTDSLATLLAQLSDIHAFTQQNLPDEQLWPLSMPPLVAADTPIPLADYGCSNLGKVKKIYRQGLFNRYGGMMQIISGIHFNFSMPDSFWREWQDLVGEGCCCKDFVSDRYMGMIRNVYRFGWLIPYLFGASPAIAKTFLPAAPQQEGVRELDDGSWLFPYATSLRLSDIGYTNSGQSQLQIDHNALANYIASVRTALQTPSAQFAQLGVLVEGDYRQLNSNLLQLENELYAPIRPKRPPRQGERPTQALARGGIEYVELRTLDINPFTPLGVDETTLRFCDLFLLWSLLRPSAPLTAEEQQRNRNNQQRVALLGRQPKLQLENEHGAIELRRWGEELFAEMAPLAELLDRGLGRPRYQTMLAELRLRLENPELTPSAQLAKALQEQGGLNPLGVTLGAHYRQQLLALPLRFWDLDYFSDEAEKSLLKQQELEQSDHLTLEQFLALQ